VLPKFVDLNDMGMLQGGDHLGFQPEAAATVGAGQGAVSDYLESDEPFELQFASQVHDPDAAMTQLLEDFIAGNTGSCVRIVGGKAARQADFGGSIGEYG
jgi:hypothetical protein